MTCFVQNRPLQRLLRSHSFPYPLPILILSAEGHAFKGSLVNYGELYGIPVKESEEKWSKVKLSELHGTPW